jgi:hypothetical protein
MVVYYLLLVATHFWCPAIGSAHPGAHALRFAEVFASSLGDYWCEEEGWKVVDVEQDGRMEIVGMLTDWVGGIERYRARLVLFQMSPTGGYEESVLVEFPGDYGYGVQVGDMNKDGYPDLIVRAWLKTHVLLNDRQGGFPVRRSVPTGFFLGPPVDVNRDGHLDLISGTQTELGGYAELFLNDGTGTNYLKSWQSRLYAGHLFTIRSVLGVRLDGDERIDLAAREIYSGRLITFRGNDDPTNAFVEQQVLGFGSRVFSLAAGRVNGDALDDIVVSAGHVRVFVAHTNGSIIDHWTSPPLGGAGYNLELADFDRDGYDDIFIGTFDDGRLQIFRNEAGAGFSPWWEDALPGLGYHATVADVNSDGWPDLLLTDQNEHTEISTFRIWLNQSRAIRITGLQPLHDQTRVSWMTVVGQRYQLQATTNWNNEDWLDVAGPTLAVGTNSTGVDFTRTGHRFYRVRVLE